MAVRTPTSYARQAAEILEPLNHPASHSFPSLQPRGFGGASQVLSLSLSSSLPTYLPPTPYTILPTPYTLHHSPYTLHPTP